MKTDQGCTQTRENEGCFGLASLYFGPSQGKEPDTDDSRGYAWLTS